MARRPFEPHGEEARWKTIYKRLVLLDVGDTITYGELSEIVGYDIREDRGPYQRAAEELLDIDHRALVNERGVGYKVIRASEHREQARRKTKEADRRLGTAQRIVDGADRNGLTAEETRRLDDMALALSGVRDMTRRLSRRQDKLEAALKATRRESKESVAALDERLARMERLLQPQDVQQTA
jgi:hypothetical protein